MGFIRCVACGARLLLPTMEEKGGSSRIDYEPSPSGCVFMWESAPGRLMGRVVLKNDPVRLMKRPLHAFHARTCKGVLPGPAPEGQEFFAYEVKETEKASQDPPSRGV